MEKERDFKILFDKLGEALDEQGKTEEPDTLVIAQEDREIGNLQKIIAEITDATEESGTYTRA